MSFEPQEVVEWRRSLQDYSRHKREVRPELYRNPDYHPPRTHVEVKQSEYAFDPVLNRYRSYDADSKYGSSAAAKSKSVQPRATRNSYDIITLTGAPAEEAPRSKGCLSVDPHSQPYNIITNAIRNPNHKAFRVRMKKINEEVFRDYNIINNQYWKNNSEKSQKDWERCRDELRQKYKDTHDFDPVRCVYYNPEKETKFWTEEEGRARALSELKNGRLPKSYKFREPINLNHEKNAFVSEGFEAFKCKERAKMKRYQKRYEMEAHFREFGQKVDERSENLRLNKYYARRFVEEYKEGVDPVTLEPEHMTQTLEHALGNKKEFVTEKPRPKRKFRFVY